MFRFLYSIILNLLNEDLLLQHIMNQLESVCENWIFLNFSKYNPIDILNLSRNINKEDLFLFSKYVLVECSPLQLNLTFCCRWYLKMNYKTLQQQIQETTDLDDETKQEIVREQWPGNKYETIFQEWKQKFAVEKENADSACSLM